MKLSIETIVLTETDKLSRVVISGTIEEICTTVYTQTKKNKNLETIILCVAGGIIRNHNVSESELIQAMKKVDL